LPTSPQASARRPAASRTPPPRPTGRQLSGVLTPRKPASIRNSAQGTSVFFNVSASQTRTPPSCSATASAVPSGVKATEVTACCLPRRAHHPVPGAALPQPDRAVLPARCQGLAVRGEGNGGHPRQVNPQRGSPPSRRKVLYPDRAVAASDGQYRPVRR